MASPLQGNITTERVEGVAGDLADSGENDVLSYLNDDPRTAQVDTITTPADPSSSPGADTTYTVTVNGIEITYTDDGSPTRAEIAEGLRDAVNTESRVNGTVVATATATETVLTARVAGEGFTTTVDSNLSLTNTTANDEADSVPFGRAVIVDSLANPKTAKAVNGTDVTDADDADAKICGVTLRDKSQELDVDSDLAEYGPNQPMSVLRDGRVYVEIEGSIPSDPTDVFVRTTADGSLDKIGGFAGASGTGLVQWSGARWVRSAGSGLAVLDVSV